jgi:integrase
MLAELPRVEGCPYLFPGRGRKHINPTGMIELLQNMEGYADYTVHGFRSTFSDWARDHNSHPRDVVEAGLAHKVKDQTEAAYRRRTSVPKRTPLMEDWAAFCDAARTGDVVPMRRKATA